jgi:hypothetical protein
MNGISKERHPTGLAAAPAGVGEHRGKVQDVLVGVGAGDIGLLADAALLFASAGVAEVDPDDGVQVHTVQHPGGRSSGNRGRVGEAQSLDDDGVGHSSASERRTQRPMREIGG